MGTWTLTPSMWLDGVVLVGQLDLDAVDGRPRSGKSSEPIGEGVGAEQVLQLE